MANNKLTPKQEAFILAYLETGNASEAYRRAYNASGMNAATINREAHSLLEHPKVAPRIRELQNHVTNQAVEQVALSRAWVLDRLVRDAQVCLGEIPLRLKGVPRAAVDQGHFSQLPKVESARSPLFVERCSRRRSGSGAVLHSVRYVRER